MAGPLSYEPSIEAILSDVLPPSAQVIAGGHALRRRASWVVLARATGLGEIAGGEIILVPPGRSASLFPRLRDLKIAGIAGVVVAGQVGSEPDAKSESDLPVIQVSADTDLKGVQSDIERYIARRRRELFALGQALHRSLTDAAIGGASLEALLHAAHTHARRPILFDRDGDITKYPADDDSVPSALVIEARIALHGALLGPMRIAKALAAPVTAGEDRRGIVLLSQTHSGTVDDDEAVLSSLASACAIALARTPDTPIPSLESMLRALQMSDVPDALTTDPVTAIALRHEGIGLRQLERAFTAEMAMRAISHLSGSVRDTLVAVTAAGESVPWETIVHSIARRLGILGLEGGIGRPNSAQESCREALDALAFSTAGQATRYQQIELAALLRAAPAWQTFAHNRLGPLIGGGAARDDLLQTLHAYLATGRNAKAAAGILHVHRNTLLYRLRRLRDLLRMDLDDQNTLFELELALRALDAAEGNLNATRTADSG